MRGILIRIHSIFTVFAVILCFSCTVGNDLHGKTECVISGESFVFYGTKEKDFHYKCERIKSVYSYDENGNRIVYKEADYLFSNNSLSRTESSSIPDFKNYSVNFNEDTKFTFISEPRNPPLIINYTVYVDYVTYVNDFLFDDNKNVCKDNNYDEEINVLVCGDSIAAGAQTISQFYKGNLDDSFSGLLRKYIESQDIACRIDNYSLVNSGIANLTHSMDSIINNNYDVVIIEYGMNDHLTVNGGTKHIAAFIEELESNIGILLSKNITVIVLGFFQQNMLWNFEDIEATRSFNVAMENLCADYEIPFVDMYRAFEKFEGGGKVYSRGFDRRLDASPEQFWA